MPKITICIDIDNDSVSTITQNKDGITIKIEKKTENGGGIVCGTIKDGCISRASISDLECNVSTLISNDIKTIDI